VNLAEEPVGIRAGGHALTSMRTRAAESFVRERASRAVVRRRIFSYLAAVTFVIAVGAALLVTIVDSKDFPTLEDGICWAIVTLGHRRLRRPRADDDPSQRSRNT
jgi:hypothetical protein